ncbi:MAG: DUF2254 domain-containing protein [Ilumatobacteraceae bacterium]
MKPRHAVKQAWRDGGRGLLLVRSYVEKLRSSLFFVPVVWIAAAIGLSQLITWIDVRTLDDDRLPSFLDTTVESARALLGAISSGTIGAASVVFSLTLVAIQMSSSVYTSRVLRSFLRDRFQQHMIGILLAAFTYSLLVLREVRGPLDPESEDATAYIPRLSVFLAVVFAIVAVLALLASISHTSQSLRASAVTRQLVGELVELVQNTFPDPERGVIDTEIGTASASDIMTTNRQRSASAHGDDPPGGVGAQQDRPGATLTADRRGWVQQVSLAVIRDAITDRSSVRLEVSPGTYVYSGAPLLTLWPPPSADEVDDLMGDLRGAFAIGDQRSMQQDIAFGFTMLEDIANKALSPGVNDPNTAVAVIEQLAEVVVTVLERDLHPAQMTLDGCVFTSASVVGYGDMVVAAFNQIRHYANGQPAVQLVLVRTLVNVGDELIRRGRERPEALDALRSMLRHVEADLAPPASDPTAVSAHRLIAETGWYQPI